MEDNLWVGMLALLSALQFALATLCVKRGVQHTDSVTGAVVAIGISLAVFVLAAPFTTSINDWASPAVWIFALIGLMRPSMSTMLAFEGNRRLGPTVAVTVESVSPIIAVSGGVLVLDERLPLLAAVGTVGVVAGVMALSYQKGGRRDWPLWALVLPLGAALIRSTAHIAAKWGLNILPNVLLSGLVAYGVSFIVAYLAAFTWGRARRRAGLVGMRVPRGALVWLIPTGLLNAGAILSLNAGLMLGEVGLVSPLVATVPVFTLILSLWVDGRESINLRTLIGVALVVPSVVLVTLTR